ncbi:MAG: hypothetical protein GY814_20265, partial [Gammaproteobacteria bacterium]|nr:hypothetical protein [Gammaproteobacteria bacterium]
ALISNPLLGTDLKIDAKAAVTGISNGIKAFNRGRGALSITTAAVTGSKKHGIWAFNTGLGALSITSTGMVMGVVASGSGYAGIKAEHYNTSSTENLTIDVAAVTGGDHGIWAINEGTGETIITTSGAVTGATGITIGASGSRANNAAALIYSNAPITGTAGFAINLQGDGHDVVTLGPDSVITGSIDFGNGNDGNGGTNANDIDTLNVLAGFNGVIN